MTKRDKEKQDMLRSCQKGGMDITLENLEQLCRDSRTLRKLFECECNGCTREKSPGESWQDYDVDREKQMEWVDKRQNVVLKRIAKRCAALGVDFYIQSDPRGCSLYISKPNSGMNNTNYSTTGVAIY